MRTKREVKSILSECIDYILRDYFKFDMDEIEFKITLDLKENEELEDSGFFNLEVKNECNNIIINSKLFYEFPNESLYPDIEDVDDNLRLLFPN